jgi:Arc/MetJ family transcription regulator
VRTTLDLDDDLLAALAARHPDLSKTEAIEMAVRHYVTESAIDELRRLAGTLDIADASRELRATEDGRP